MIEIAFIALALLAGTLALVLVAAALAAGIEQILKYWH